MSVMRRFQVALTYADYDQLVARAQQDGRSIAATAQRVLVAWLREPEGRPPALVEMPRGPVTPRTGAEVEPIESGELKYEPLG